ncbi:MAG: protein BatD [Muribaculaceae bacterium]|nr:protein BatD [Muribaculaceae bacterium]
MIKIRHIISLTLLLATLAAHAATFRVQAPTRVEVGGKFRVEYVLEGAEGINPSFPQLDGATLLYGPSVSTSMSMTSINGQTSTNYSQVFTMLYEAVTPGKHTLAPATITADGRKLTTRSTTIEIVPASGNGSPSAQYPNHQPQPYQPQPNNDPDFTNPMNQTAGSNVDANDFFVKVSMSKDVVYEQEAVVCLIKLFTRYNVSKFHCTQQPTFNGFLIEELPVDNNSRPQVETVNGKQYYTAVLKKCILYPQQSGKLTITSGNYDVQLVQFDVYSTPMGQISNPVPIDIQVKSNSASVNIKPLPEPKPANFSGAVGEFTATSKIYPHSFKTYAPATYSIIVSGTGNLKYIQNPVVVLPREFDTYDPQSKVNLSPDGNNMSGDVTFEYPFIPQHIGDFEIPDTYFVYFNTTTQQYDSIKVNGCKLKVEKGEGKPSDHYKLRNMDIRPISTDEMTLSKGQNFFVTKWWYWLIFAAALALAFAGLAFYRKIEKTHADTSLMRTRRASKVAQRRLKKAQECLNNHDSNGFYTEMLTALWGYLSDKLTIPVSELSKDNIAMEMEKFGFPQEHIDDTMSMLETCEFAQYAPSLDEGDMPAVYDKCAQLIDQLEKTKRRKTPTT